MYINPPIPDCSDASAAFQSDLIGGNALHKIGRLLAGSHPVVVLEKRLKANFCAPYSSCRMRVNGREGFVEA
jgi:hypothetical protein